MGRNKSLNLIGCSVVATVFVIGMTEAIEYKVGDSFGWNVPTNQNFYSDWASTKSFFLGDKLKADYNNCNNDASSFGSNLNQTEFQVRLETLEPYYFMCTIGNHCERGQKFSINVESPNANTPTYPQPGSAPPTLSFGILSAFLSSLAVYFLTRTS